MSITAYSDTIDSSPIIELFYVQSRTIKFILHVTLCKCPLMKHGGSEKTTWLQMRVREESIMNEKLRQGDKVVQ